MNTVVEYSIVMPFKEYIDGEVPFDDDLPQDMLAVAVVTELLECVKARRERGPNELGRAAFRLTSWVESADAKLGHALALSEVGDPGDLDAPIISGKLYTVDRETHAIIGQAKELSLKQARAASPEQQVEDIANSFDRPELNLTLELLGKAATTFMTGEVQFDKDVAMALIDSNLEELADQFPGKSDPNTEHSEQVCKSPEFIQAAQALAADAKHTDPYGDQVILMKAFDATTYIVNVSFEAGMLEAVELLQYQRGAWVSDFYHYHPFGNEEGLEDDDEVLLELDHEWDEHMLIETLTSGKQISHSMYSKLSDASNDDDTAAYLDQQDQDTARYFRRLGVRSADDLE